MCLLCVCQALFDGCTHRRGRFEERKFGFPTNSHPEKVQRVVYSCGIVVGGLAFISVSLKKGFQQWSVVCGGLVEEERKSKQGHQVPPSLINKNSMCVSLHL